MTVEKVEIVAMHEGCVCEDKVVCPIVSTNVSEAGLVRPTVLSLVKSNYTPRMSLPNIEGTINVVFGDKQVIVKRKHSVCGDVVQLCLETKRQTVVVVNLLNDQLLQTARLISTQSVYIWWFDRRRPQNNHLLHMSHAHIMHDKFS
jgi:hypothetical protein